MSADGASDVPFKHPWLLTVAYYVVAISVSWLAVANSGPANGGPNGGMVFTAAVVVVSCVLALISIVSTVKGNASTRLSSFVHLMVLICVFGWWSNLR